jgi:hypothetical protein
MICVFGLTQSQIDVNLVLPNDHDQLWNYFGRALKRQGGAFMLHRILLHKYLLTVSMWIASPMGRLPQELIDTIIDQFAPRGEDALPDQYYVPESERAALRDCSLASRTFLPRCREHLFASLDCITDDSSRLEALISGPPLILTSYVKYLTIGIYSDTAQLPDPVMFTLASQLLGLIPKLVHLSISFSYGPALVQWNEQPEVLKKRTQRSTSAPQFSESLSKLVHLHGCHGARVPSEPRTRS